MIKEHDCIVLTTDLPAEGLAAGDIGTVVHIHKGGEGYEIEFMTLDGQTVAVSTLLANQGIRLKEYTMANTGYRIQSHDKLSRRNAFHRPLNNLRNRRRPRPVTTSTLSTEMTMALRG